MQKKLDSTTISTKTFDQNQANSLDKAEELETPFNCDECNYKGTSKKGIMIQKRKQHKIGAQIDGQDDFDIKEDVSVQTEDPLLFILYGYIATDCEDEYIGETFWRLSEEFYFDHFHTNAVRRAPKGCWMNRCGDFLNKQKIRSLGESFLNSFTSLGSIIRLYFIYV